MNPPPDSTKTTIYCGKWLNFYTLNTTNSSGITFKDYSCLSRTTKKDLLSYDALSIIALKATKENPKKQIVLIAEYRPPVSGFVLELPAGLAESLSISEDIEREMLEETGYFINKTKIYESPLITAEPKLLEILAKIFIVEIDGDNEKNVNPRQRLEEEENIRVHLVDLDENFMKNVMELAHKNKYFIHDKVFFIAKGLSEN